LHNKGPGDFDRRILHHTGDSGIVTPLTRQHEEMLLWLTTFPKISYCDAIRIVLTMPDWLLVRFLDLGYFTQQFYLFWVMRRLRHISATRHPEYPRT